MSDRRKLLNALECILFVADRALKTSEIARALKVSEGEALSLLQEFAETLRGRGLQLEEVAGGWRLSTKPEYAEYIRRLLPERRERLSKAALETLAIIAYRQPITRPEIEHLRGVRSDATLATLLQRQLIKPVGRKRTAGRPLMYATTEKFLELFGLRDLSELPPLDEEGKGGGESGGE